MYGLFKQIHAQNVFEKEYSTLIYLRVNVNIGRVLYTDSPLRNLRNPTLSAEQTAVAFFMSIHYSASHM